MTLRNRGDVNWDPKNFEIRTLSVERQLEQLVKQVNLKYNKLKMRNFTIINKNHFKTHLFVDVLLSYYDVF